MGLDNPANQYDKFAFNYYVNDSGYRQDLEWTSSNSSGSTQNTIYGLSPGDKVEVHAFGVWRGTWYEAGYDVFYVIAQAPLPRPPTGMSVSDLDGTSAHVSWYTDSSVDYYDVYLDGSYYSSVNYGDVLVYGLKENTSYRVCVEGCNSRGCSSRTCISFKTTSGLSKPRPWDWGYEMKSGGRFYDYTSDGRPKVLSAYEWNMFTARINEWNEYYKNSKFSFTRATSGAVFRYRFIDEADRAIAEMAGDRVWYPQEVNASTFNGLRDRLNRLR